MIYLGGVSLAHVDYILLITRTEERAEEMKTMKFILVLFCDFNLEAETSLTCYIYFTIIFSKFSKSKRFQDWDQHPDPNL